ncbi:MAG: Uncharacterized protein XD84_1358 [Desulfotomaculum sp. 46_80]|nr:MAG: Uncharacterized protein XD84_1358 [Desulfotomaculum sp. 46_80]
MGKQAVYCIRLWKDRILNKFKNLFSVRPGSKLHSYLKKILNLSDSPKKIAGGVALGLAFDFLPIPIISIPLSYLAARAVKVNPVAAVSTVVILKLAVPSFYALDFFVGKLLFGDIQTGLDIHDMGISTFDFFLDKLFEHGYPFILGSLINAAIIGFVSYYFLMWFIRRRQGSGK